MPPNRYQLLQPPKAYVRIPVPKERRPVVPPPEPPALLRTTPRTSPPPPPPAAPSTLQGIARGLFRRFLG